MRIYKDAFSNDEIISDSFNIVSIYEGAGGEIQAKYIKKGGEEFDIGCGNEFGGQSEEEKAQDQVEKVLDVIDVFHYQETPFTKKDYTDYLKGYMKKVKTYLEANNKDRVAPFMKGAQEMFKYILGKFDEFTFYTPESFDTENCIILSYYKNPDDETPTFLYFMDGLKSVEM